MDEQESEVEITEWPAYDGQSVIKLANAGTTERFNLDGTPHVPTERTWLKQKYRLRK